MTINRIRTRAAASALCIMGLAGGTALVAGGSGAVLGASGAGQGVVETSPRVVETDPRGVETAPRVVEAEVSEMARQLRPLNFRTGVYVDERINQQVSVPPGVTFQFRNLPPGLNYNPSTTGIYGTPTTPGTWDVTATAYLAGVPVETATSRVTITGNATAPAPAPGGGAPAPTPGGAPGAGGPGAPGAPTFAAGIDLAVIDTLPLPPEVKQAAKDALINFDRAMADFWASVPQS